MRRRTKAGHFVETKSQNRAPPSYLFPCLSPQIMQREQNIVCIYNYVNMSSRVSIVTTDYSDCMSFENIWMERGVVAGSHHSPESFIIFFHYFYKKKKKNRENILKKITLGEDRTPTILRKSVCRTMDVTAQPSQISAY